MIGWIKQKIRDFYFWLVLPKEVKKAFKELDEEVDEYLKGVKENDN